MFWNANSSTKFVSFSFDRYRIEDSPIDYLQNKYTYALIKISPMSKVCWLLQSSWKHELKLPHNSSLRYKRRRFKNALENYTMEQIFFKAMSVVILLVQVSENKNKNTTKHNKTKLLISPRKHINKLFLSKHNLRTANLRENFAILKKCPRKLDYLIFQILLIKKEKTGHKPFRTLLNIVIFSHGL